MKFDRNRFESLEFHQERMEYALCAHISSTDLWLLLTHYEETNEELWYSLERSVRLYLDNSMRPLCEDILETSGAVSLYFLHEAGPYLISRVEEFFSARGAKQIRELFIQYRRSVHY